MDEEMAAEGRLETGSKFTAARGSSLGQRRQPQGTFRPASDWITSHAQ